MCSSADPNIVTYGEFKIPLSLSQLIKLQSAVRGYIARKHKAIAKHQKMKAIMSNNNNALILWIDSLLIFISFAYRGSIE